jgi:hypothetical protein
LKTSLKLANEAGFRHSWTASLDDDTRTHLYRPDRSHAIFHRKQWQQLAPLESAWQFPLQTSKPVILLGSGSGAILPVLLQTAVPAIFVIEKHPLLLHHAFEQYDFTEPILQKRLHFPDPFEIVTGEVALPAEAQWVHHPVLGREYRDIPALLQTAGKTFDLVFEGELLVDDWYDTIIQSGRSAYIYPHFWLPPDRIRRDVNHAMVERLWSINRINGLETAAEEAGKQYSVFEIDPDLSEIPVLGKPLHHTKIFSFRPGQAAEYQDRNWNATFLPLAAALRMVPSFSEKHVCPISFVGTSIIGNAETLTGLLYDALSDPEAQKLLTGFKSAQQDNPEVFLADEYLARLTSLGVGAFVAGTRGMLSVRKILHEWSGAVHRIHLVKSLAPLGIHVWGDEGWKTVAASSPGMVYRGPAGNRIEVPKIYSSSRINIDITRNYQPDVATIRLFDVFACGSICLTNVTGPAAAIFEKPGLLQFNTAASLFALTEEVMNWPVNRYKEYVNNLSAQVRTKHMLGNRLAFMLAE